MKIDKQYTAEGISRRLRVPSEDAIRLKRWAIFLGCGLCWYVAFRCSEVFVSTTIGAIVLSIPLGALFMIMGLCALYVLVQCMDGLRALGVWLFFKMN